MVNILLAAILLVNLAVLAGLVHGFLTFRRVKASFEAFVTPPSEGQPSPLANATDAIAGQFGRAITASIKTTLMGYSSGIVRAEKGLQGDVAEDVARQTPLGGLLDSFPTVRRTLRKNPGLLDLALGLLANRGNGHATDPGATTNYQPKFKL